MIVKVYEGNLENVKNHHNSMNRGGFRAQQIPLRTTNQRRVELCCLNKIVNLNCDIFREVYEEEPYSLEHYQKILFEKKPFIFLAKHEFQLVGDSISFEKDNSFYLWILGVKKLEKYRKKGMGNFLLHMNEKLAKEKGFSDITTKVYDVSLEMKTLLKKRNYEVIGFRGNMTDPKYNILYYRKEL